MTGHQRLTPSSRTGARRSHVGQAVGCQRVLQLARHQGGPSHGLLRVAMAKLLVRDQEVRTEARLEVEEKGNYLLAGIAGGEPVKEKKK